MKHKKLLSILSAVFLSFNGIEANTDMPDWVTNRPINSLFYIGIGSAKKKQNEPNFQQVAKNEALRDLSSEINIHISGEIVSNLAERSGLIAEEVKSHISSSTQANLEGFEQVGVYENQNTYWVYYRMSKSEYASRTKAHKQNIVGMAWNIFRNAQKNEATQNISTAFSGYIQAFRSLEEFLGEPVEITIDGKPLYLQNELFSSLQNLLNSIEIQTPSAVSYKIGRTNSLVVPIHVAFTGKGGTKQPIQDFPVRFFFLKGDGNLVDKEHSDKSGVAPMHIVSITAPDKLQIIKVQADISPTGQDTISPIATGILNKLSLPQARCIVNVSGLSVFIKSEEYQFGKKIISTYVEPQVKKGLSAFGFTFVTEASKADLIIDIVANSHQGSVIADYNLYSAFADVTISITDIAIGKEIYKEALNAIKDADTNYEKAGIKALTKAGKKINEMIPDIVAKIQ